MRRLILHSTNDEFIKLGALRYKFDKDKELLEIRNMVFFRKPTQKRKIRTPPQQQNLSYMVLIRPPLLKPSEKI